jgi:dolichol-phosphate mannosyltransferase
MLSFVIPCFNEAEVLPESLRRISSVVADNFGASEVELLLVDDGSTDGSVQLALETELAANMRLRVIRLSRNFGHQAAVTAGISAALGDAIIVMDADLQDPPEIVPEMLAALDRGFDVVSGRRVARRGTPWPKRLAYATFYRALRLVVSDFEIPLDTGDFRVISRRAADLLNALPERKRFVRWLLPFLGLPATEVRYARQPRYAGRPKYSFSKLLDLALDGILTFSTRPLRIGMYSGFALFGLSAIGVLSVLVVRLATDEWAPGWAGLMIVGLGFGGLQFLFIGLLGEYVGRVFEEVKGRPAYVVVEELG